MRILSIDTATRFGGLALWHEGNISAEWIVSGGLTHSARLMPALDFLLKEAGWEIKDIDLLAVSQGPGSFTGLRIGMATAKGLAQALKIDLVGVPTLKFWAASFSGGEGLVLPLLDARRNEFYTALYRKEQDAMIELLKPSQERMEELPRLLEKYEGPIWAVGDAVSRDAEMLRKVFGSRLKVAPESLRLPRPSVLAQLAAEQIKESEPGNYKLLGPLYLRQSEAEVKRLAKLHEAKEE